MKVLYIVSNIFPHAYFTRAFTPDIPFHHFTTHIYPSHYAPLSPLPYTSLHFYMIFTTLYFLLFLVRFLWNLIFRDKFSKNTRISDFMTIRPVADELFHAVGRTDMTKLIISSRNFANAPKKRHLQQHAISLLWGYCFFPVDLFSRVNNLQSSCTHSPRTQVLDECESCGEVRQLKSEIAVTWNVAPCGLV
jgi:hypothetical protein